MNIDKPENAQVRGGVREAGLIEVAGDARRDAQFALGPSDDRLRLALEAAGLGTFRVNVGDDEVHYSPELAEMLGVPGTSTVPVGAAMERVHRDDIAAFKADYAKALDPAGTGHMHMEYRFVLPGGSVRWLTWTGRTEFRDFAGKRLAVSVLGVCADTTERRIKESRLRESEERFRALVALSSDWYWEQDEHFRFVFISEPVQKFSGINPQSRLGKCRWELPTVGVSEAQWCEHRRLLAQHLPFRDFEYRQINDRGETVWLLTKGEPVFDSEGRFKGYRGIGQNVTARKEAERKLRESEARFQLLADSAPVLIWVTGPEGAIYFNRPYIDFVGARDETELTGKGWAAYLHPDDKAAYLAASTEAARTRAPFIAQARYRGVDGGYRWMKSIGLPRFSENGDYLGYIGSTLDITDLKLNEARVALLVRELDHRVKNILARVEVVIERTQEGQTAVAPFGEALRRRVRAMSRAHDLLSRSQWCGAGMHEIIDVQVAPFATESNVTIAGPDLLLNPDAAQALSIVMNELATNAAKYGALSRSSGKVDVRWRVIGAGGGHDEVVVEWIESGGPPVDASAKPGYGSTVIKDLPAHELDAKVELLFGIEGVSCRMRMPLNGLAAEAGGSPLVASVVGMDG